MSTGSVIDGEPSVAAKALALKRALVETVADAGINGIDNVTMALLNTPVDLLLMYQFGGGTTAHNTTRGSLASSRVANFAAAQVETHLAAIDTRIKQLGGS